MIILDTLLIGGLRFVLGKIASAVEAEMTDDSGLREALLAAQMRLELGEITEAEFVEIERDLLARINEIRGQRTPAAVPSSGKWTVAGVDFAGEESPEAEEESAGRRRRR